MKKPFSYFWSICALATLATFSAPSAKATIVLGQVDDFEDGSNMNWGGGSSPTNIPGGGPAGAGDYYLQLSAFGGSGPGSRLGSYNDFQWAGNYTAAGVTSIDADLKNFGATDLHLRLMFFGSGGNFTSTLPIVVQPDGLWHHVTFPVTPADLTAVDGGIDANATLADNARLLIRHQSGAPGGTFDGTPVLGQLGLDNIEALPEPGTIGLLVLGGLLLRRRR